MRIGIDARELGGRVTGVGKYLVGLLREWSRESASNPHEFVLYAHEPPTGLEASSIVHHRVIPGAPGTWWEQVQLPPVAARDHLDVFFAPAYTAPLRLRVPIVLTIHDLSYEAHPEWFPVREGVRRRFVTRRSAMRARALITVSEFSRREISEHLGIGDERVHVVPQGIDRVGVALHPGVDPRVLFVGSIFNRRHVPALIHAVAAVARRWPATSLDIVGDNRTFPYQDLEQTIARVGLDRQVRWHRYVTNARLLELYGRARAFAFLSEYEGLGMTPIEALGAGIPPVLFDTTVARESCGDAALYVPVGDHAATWRALERALFDDEARAAVLAAAPAVLARYDWPRAARDTLAVLEAAAGS